MTASLTLTLTSRYNACGYNLRALGGLKRFRRSEGRRIATAVTWSAQKGYKRDKFLPYQGSSNSIIGIRRDFGRELREISTTAMGSMDLASSTWGRSPAEFDFRSDTLTSPTLKQLAALQTASLGDDVYTESTTTSAFEARMASVFGKAASIFVMSGTMGNQLALRALLTQPPHTVLCDHRAHIQNYEAGGLAMLSQALILPTIPANGKHLTLEDVKKHACIGDNIHYAPTKVISLENTLGGNIFPLEEIQRIASWARENNIHMHLDGARLWNAVSVYESVEKQLEMLRAYAKEFDTVTVCFSKSLGAPVGSVIISTEEVCKKVRHFRKAIGGGIRQAGILTAMADAAFEEVFLGGRLKATNEKAVRIGRYWVEECGRDLKKEVETNMVWLDMQGEEQALEERAKELGVKVNGGRMVVHWQISDEAVDNLCKALKAVAQVIKSKPNGGEIHRVDDYGNRR